MFGAKPWVKEWRPGKPLNYYVRMFYQILNPWPLYQHCQQMLTPPPNCLMLYLNIWLGYILFSLMFNNHFSYLTIIFNSYVLSFFSVTLLSILAETPPCPTLSQRQRCYTSDYHTPKTSKRYTWTFPRPTMNIDTISGICIKISRKALFTVYEGELYSNLIAKDIFPPST